MLSQEEYDKKEAMYNENEVLRDLCDLFYANGLHTGRWENELGIEESCEEYLATMVALAEKYHIEYDKDLANYVDDEDNPEYMAIDRMGLEIQEIVEKYLLEILIH